MGAAITAVRDQLDQADKQELDQAKETLKILYEQGQAIAEKKNLEIANIYKDQNSFKEWQVVGGRIDKFTSVVQAATKDHPSSDISNGIESIIDGLFAGGNQDGDFQDGLKSMVEGALKAVLGAAEGTFQEYDSFAIIPFGMAFYRVDYYVRYYAVSSQGFKDHFQGVSVTVATRGILSVEDLKPAEVMAYIGEMFGTNESKINNWVDRCNKVSLKISGKPFFADGDNSKPNNDQTNQNDNQQKKDTDEKNPN